MKNRTIIVVLVAIVALCGCARAAHEVPVSTSLPTCDARAALHPARSGTPYDFEQRLIETPCVLSAHPTLEDAKLVWARAEFLLVCIDSDQPWSAGIHNAHDQTKSDAMGRAIAVLTLLNEWEDTGKQPSTFRTEQEAFAIAVDKANTGPGRVLTNPGCWIMAGDVNKPENGAAR